MGMSEVLNPQHLNPEAVEEYFRLGVRSAFNLSENPLTRLVIDPVRKEIQLLTPTAGGEPDVAAFERLTLRRRVPAGQSSGWYELTVDASDMHYEAYVLIESIVDQLRAGASFRRAVSESLEALKDLLASRQRLTEEKIHGLLGELLVMSHVVEHDGEDAAIAAWLGPLAEEHDFGFPDFDVEVKTTKSEARVHVIGNATQLEPQPNRPLYLLSVQITRAGAAVDAFTLPQLIERTRSKLQRNLRAFDAALEGLGWRDGDADLYRTRYQLRSNPRAYSVDGCFPSITSTRLASVIPQPELVVSVSYRVDVTHLDGAAVPAPLNDFCEETE